MISFLIKDGRLTIDAKALTVPAFNEVWEFYEDKKDSQAMFIYIFGMKDITINNPYLDVPHYERDAVVKNSVFGDRKYKFSEDEKKLLNVALPAYEKLNKDSPYRMLDMINLKIDEIERYARTNKIDSDNLNQQIAMIEKVEKLIKSKAVVEEYVAKEIKKTKTQGDFTRSPLETGQIGYKRASKEA